MKIYCDFPEKEKTTKLIKESAGTGDYIVCFNSKEAIRIKTKAQKMRLDIPLPITYDEFLHRRYCGKNIKGFLIDNVDLLLQSLTQVPINSITINKSKIF